MPPIEYAIIAGVLCWRFEGGSCNWKVSSPSCLTNEINSLRAQLGLEAYPVLEDAESE